MNFLRPIVQPTFDSMNIQFYSETVDRTPCHMHNFLLHSKNERESMFAII
jgi:hypothetical protein